MQKRIDFKNKRCKYIMILQDLKKIFQKLQNYSKKGLLVTLLHLVTKNLFYDKSCVFAKGNEKSLQKFAKMFAKVRQKMFGKSVPKMFAKVCQKC
jgi:hypothetical protein